MTDQHPITPPPELVKQWREMPEYASISEKLFTVSITTNKLQDIATQAANWGSGQELEACCEYLTRCAAWEREDIQEMRDLRRPKPPSLKEQALRAWAAVGAGTDDQTAMAVIRRALESLPD
jgi:hypothetical protein